DQGIHLVHGLKANMKNKLMPMWDKIMLRKRYIIECINELLKNKANLVHSRHRSIHNFMMNLCSALAAYCFFDNKPEALPVHVEKSRQLELFAW
ncbi:transposase, partial [Prevotella sp. KH2C16]